MKSLLKRIDTKILKQVIGNERLKKIDSIIDCNKGDFDVIHLIQTFLGDNILDNKVIRKEMIKLLPEKDIKELSISYCGKTYASSESAAIQLTAKRWSVNTLFPSDLLTRLDISFNYLPKRAQNISICETIIPINKYFPLFDYQYNVMNDIVAKIEQNVPKFIVQMPTGSGKTKTSIEAIITYNNKHNFFAEGKSVIWIAHTEELCEQAIESLKNIWINTQQDSLRIIRYYGGFSPTEDELYGSFIFSSYQKLCSNKSKRYLDLLSKSCLLIFIDEAHKALAPTYNEMLKSLCIQGACLVGLTATPGRKASSKIENSEFALFFNRQIVSPDFGKNSIVALREMNVLSKLDHQTFESNITLSAPLDSNKEHNDDYSLKQLESLSSSTIRNKLIVKIIKRELSEGNPCLVFACSTEHSIIIASVLNFMGIKASYIDSSINKSHRRKIISDFKSGKFDVLINYGVLSTGFDAPRIKTVIITRPTASIVLYSQMIGRGLRGSRMGGNDTCRIIDILDNCKGFGPVEEIYDFFDGYWS